MPFFVQLTEPMQIVQDTHTSAIALLGGYWKDSMSKVWALLAP